MDAALNVLHPTLAFGGVYIYSKREWTSKLRLGHQIFSYLCCIVMLISNTGFLFDNLSDTEISLEAAALWSNWVIVFVSFGICLVLRKKFRIFLEEMVFKDEILPMPFIECIMKRENGGKLKELMEMIEASHENLFKYTRIMATVYIILAVLSHSLYISDGVYCFISKTYSTRQREAALMLWLPWSLEDDTVYIIAFVFYTYGGYLACSAFCGFQLTIVLLMGQVIRHLRIMTFILQYLDDLILELVHERDDHWQNSCTMVLSQCVAVYVKMKRFCNQLNVICRPFYLALILNSCMFVCICTVQTALSEDKMSVDLVKYFFNAFVFILLIFCFCLLSQQVQNECMELENAVTEKYYIFNHTHKKNVCIFHMALMQGMPIYLFGSITLSLSTFSWFLKTVMSFFTLAMSFLEN